MLSSATSGRYDNRVVCTSTASARRGPSTSNGPVSFGYAGLPVVLLGQTIQMSSGGLKVASVVLSDARGRISSCAYIVPILLVGVYLLAAVRDAAPFWGARCSEGIRTRCVRAAPSAASGDDLLERPHRPYAEPSTALGVLLC